MPKKRSEDRRNISAKRNYSNCLKAILNLVKVKSFEVRMERSFLISLDIRL